MQLRYRLKPGRAVQRRGRPPVPLHKVRARCPGEVDACADVAGSRLFTGLLNSQSLELMPSRSPRGCGPQRPPRKRHTLVSPLLFDQVSSSTLLSILLLLSPSQPAGLHLCSHGWRFPCLHCCLSFFSQQAQSQKGATLQTASPICCFGPLSLLYLIWCCHGREWLVLQRGILSLATENWVVMGREMSNSSWRFS